MTSIPDRPTAMQSWAKEAGQEMDCVYQSKTTPDRNDIATVWQSMYENGLKRKVSQYALPPQASEQNNNMSANQAAREEPQPTETEAEKAKNLATVHLERALNSGKLGSDGDHGRRWRRRAYSNSFSSDT